VLCVVEDASAVTLVDRATDFKGRYHVLGGRLSPLDGVGPDALRLDRLVSRVREGAVREVHERLTALADEWRLDPPDRHGAPAPSKGASTRSTTRPGTGRPSGSWSSATTAASCG